jgi:hypothetical protein
VIRSGASGNRCAYRPLSQIQASFTSYSSRASCRTTSPRRTSTRRLHPAEQCGQTESPWLRSNGRATNRYGVDVNAPTGQICTVFPLNGDRKSSPAAIETRSPAPRAYSSRNRSPEISSQNRVHRAQSTHRSRSKPTNGDSGIGFLNTRFASRNLLSPGP